MNPLENARVVLAVSGGIAAYKAADVASKLVQAGAVVDTVFTRGAAEFIQPLTFQALTKRPVHIDMFEPWSDGNAGHVTLAAEADLLIVAPATANTIARLALGLSDDVLGVLALATGAPMLIAPAMEHHMFHHPATQDHLETLRRRGATVVGPESGHLASGETGDGRLASPDVVLGAARRLLGRSGSLSGRRVVVTAGGTREPLDPVRFLGNGSSGTMGYALVQAAIDRGADVSLITAPVSIDVPYGADVVRVTTASELNAAVHAAVPDAHVLIMAAAVADYRPMAVSPGKIKKANTGDETTFVLTQNPDIVASIHTPGLLKVGFAAETDDLVSNATTKLREKDLAMIVANDAAATIGSSRSQATLISARRGVEPLPMLDKGELASHLLDRIIDELRATSE